MFRVRHVADEDGLLEFIQVERRWEVGDTEVEAAGEGRGTLHAGKWSLKRPRKTQIICKYSFSV